MEGRTHKRGAFGVFLASFAPIFTALLGAVVALWLQGSDNDAAAERQIELIALQRTSSEFMAWRDAVTNYSVAANRAAISIPSTPLDQQHETILSLCSLWLDGLTTKEVVDVASKYVQRKKLCANFVGGYGSLAPKGDDRDADRAECAAAPWILATARAHDQGYTPSDKDPLLLEAPSGHFLGDFEIIEESYRRRAGPPLIETMETTLGEGDSSGLPIRYTGSVSCTNSRGIGRTCESRATVRARVFPEKCAAFITAD